MDDQSEIEGFLVRWDENEWVQVEIEGVGSDIPVDDIYETSDGALWISTTGLGLLHYDGIRWAQYTTEDGLTTNDVHEIWESQAGDLWLRYEVEVNFSRFDRKLSRAIETEVEMPGRLNSLWKTKNGEIWASRFPGKIARLEKGRWSEYDQTPIARYGGAARGVSASDGTMWLYVAGTDHVFKFNPESATSKYVFREPLYGGIETADRSVWFYTGTDGVTGPPEMYEDQEHRSRAVQYRKGVWAGYSASDGFLDGIVYAMDKTSDGSLWFIGSHKGRGGVARYKSGGWKVFTPEDGLVDRIYPPKSAGFFHPPLVETQDGSIWFVGQHAGSAAVCHFDGQTWTRYTAADGLVGDNTIMAYEATDGTLWFATEKIPPAGDRIGQGLFRFDGTSWTRFTENEGLSSDYITGIAEWPNGKLWVGTFFGLSQLDLDDENPSWLNKVDFQIRLPKVRSLVATDDALWFCFLPNRSGGVVRYDGTSWTTFTQEDGLISDGVNSIQNTSDGSLWFTAQDGLTKYDGQAMTRYGDADGLSLGWLFPTLREMHDGSLWVDDSSGQVFHFRPQAAESNPETSLASAFDRIGSEGNIFLRWSGNDLWNQTSPRNLRYQWRLGTEEWSSWSNRLDYTFTSLSTGRYQFEVRSMDENGHIDPTPAVHAFVVDSPWWQSPWVVGGTVLLLGLTGLQTGRVIHRDRRLREGNEALSEANKELFGVNQSLQQKTEDLDRSNNELTVEAALERVRARALGMQESEDLDTVSASLFEALGEVGFNVLYCWIAMIKEEEDLIDLSRADPSSQVIRFTTPLSEALEYVRSTRDYVEA